ncbi:copper homeostasis protein CutC [Antarcticibacterium sp. 1MA-6-2]|uniref:copper homeostasis protein CutC n=1 Tax=Antarcticibacterium sp. 1MA-6-2 TaxID=2908210 RepID=UPI001F1ADE3C|nr:copper homeostasis protein CutC [Antarcticibacterium sp. 1MA-6-2]UJH90984.1 copper homeostasis protein CutC [Antarcticibacterium sp. 1MA-6-2]
MIGNYIKEACVENLSQVLQAQKKGANRIELCDRLDLDGTTPPRELIIAAMETGIPVRVMIRPRGGDFIYTEEELNKMESSILFCKELGVEAVVFGIQKEDGYLNYEQIQKLAKIASPLKVVVHKAIDNTPDPVGAVKELLNIEEISSILTSGGMETAFEGKNNLKKMIEIADGQIEIVVAGKVTESNIEQLNQFLHSKAYHGKRIVGDLG